MGNENSKNRHRKKTWIPDRNAESGGEKKRK
jgi:hypothetical protein